MISQLRRPLTHGGVAKRREVVLAIDIGGSTELGFVDAKTGRPIRVSDDPESPFYFGSRDTFKFPNRDEFTAWVVGRVQEMLTYAETHNLVVLGIGIASRTLPFEKIDATTVKELDYGVYSADEAVLGPIVLPDGTNGWDYCELPKAVQDAAGLKTFVAKDQVAVALQARRRNKWNLAAVFKKLHGKIVWFQGTGVGGTCLTSEGRPVGRDFSLVKNPAGGEPIQVAFVTVKDPETGEDVPLHSIGPMLYNYFDKKRQEYIGHGMPQKKAEKRAYADTADLNFRCTASQIKELAQKSGATDIHIVGGGALGMGKAYRKAAKKWLVRDPENPIKAVSYGDPEFGLQSAAEVFHVGDTENRDNLIAPSPPPADVLKPSK